MAEYKTHFSVSYESKIRGRTVTASACGPSSPFVTRSIDPLKTTCGHCKRSKRWREAMKKQGHSVPIVERAWRNIHRRDTSWKERSSIRGKVMSWSRSYVHTLTLECGHIQVRNGFTYPKHRTVCKDCEAGKPKVSIEGIEGGIFDHTNAPGGGAIKDPIGILLIERDIERAVTSAREMDQEKKAANG